MTKIFHFLQDICDFILLKFNSLFKNESIAIYFSLEDPNLYHRFLYVYIKNLKNAGYSIYFPLTFNKFRNLRHKYPYLGLITIDKGLIINNEPKKFKRKITDSDLSPLYFNDYFENKNQETGYHVPIGFHPIMYHLGVENEKVIAPQERINSVFTFGNFAKENYNEIKQTPFQIMSRVDLLDFFSTNSQFQSFKVLEDLESYIQAPTPNQFIFVKKENFQIPIEQVRPTLAKFRYFLACPGVVMPNCHNIIEAMSVGTIPILQRIYADVMYPNLENGINAFIFNDETELSSLVNDIIFKLEDKKFNELSENVLRYFNENISAKAIAKNTLNDLAQKKIYLNAEHRSVPKIV